jgi:hypothetical protein
MKTLTASCLAVFSSLFVLAATPAGASPTEDVSEVRVSSAASRRNLIMANPGALLLGDLVLQYERGLGQRFSFFVGPYAKVFNTFGVEGGELTEVGLDFGGRYFFRAHAPRGTWLGPQLGVAVASVTTHEGMSASGIGASAALLIGHTWIWNNGFSLSLGGGLGYATAEGTAGDVTVSSSGIFPAARLALGFAF